MKKLIVLCLGLVILLAACGGKINGTYGNKDMKITANSETGKATLHIPGFVSESFFGIDKHSGDYEGTVDKENKTMTFDTDNGKIKLGYKVKGDTLTINDPSGETKDKIELTKK